MAGLFIANLFHYRNQGEYKLHAFVVMRDHFHVLLTIEGTGTIERVMQKVKGGFSYRARAELGFRGEMCSGDSLMSGFGILNSSSLSVGTFTTIRFVRVW
jgi:REP element-mobilizing transposase RayT